MKALKTITVRLPWITYERLCELAEISEELPSETARRILKEFLANLGFANLDQNPSKTEVPSESGGSRLRKLIAEGRRSATAANLEKLRRGD